jgi:dolichyldiphosphatase
MMMAATAYSLIFLAVPLVTTLFYFSGACAAAAFRPSGEQAAWSFPKQPHQKKKHCFVREQPSSTRSTRIATRVSSGRRLNSIFFASATGKDEVSETSAPGIHPLILFVGGTTSIVVATSFFLALAHFRSATMISFWLGAIGNAILSKVLKKIINQSRPPELETAQMVVLPSDGGMPSSHAMSLAFIGTMTALLLPDASVVGAMAVLALRLTLVVYAAISLFYRVQVKFHTWEQIAVGVAVGAGNAGLFYNFLQPSLISWLSANILNNHDGLLPVPMLLIPIIVGLLVVGSVERRIAKWFKYYDSPSAEQALKRKE